MKPLSGSGARGMMLDAMNTYGADSFIGRLCSIVQGSSDTTFYVVALYFGSVGIRNTYYTIPCSLLADLAGAVAAVTMTYLFFNLKIIRIFVLSNIAIKYGTTRYPLETAFSEFRTKPSSD